MSDPTLATDTPIKSPMRFRRTRIGVSVFFGLLTVALCVLWVRSYWRADAIQRIGKPYMSVYSNNGYMVLVYLPKDLSQIPTGSSDWNYLTLPSNGLVPTTLWKSSARETRMAAPIKWFVLSAAAVVFLPWASTRFSLRAMLIATTLLAVVLGLGVWLVR